jgi:catechol 2,3-dioxygenase-like lactoylglutathione lyase family enzyme
MNWEPAVIQSLNHFTICAENRERTLDFYCGLLGLCEGERPPLGFPGAWLYPQGSDEAVLHVYWDRAMPEPRTGVIDHMAFTASGLRATTQRLDAAGVAYDLRRQAGSGTWQLFFHDPNGAKVELDFDAAEAGVEAPSR